MTQAGAKRLRLRLEFEGSSFCGWQLQSEQSEIIIPSVQGCIERALKIFFRATERIVVQGCGRTDAGVSAREFFLHFDISENYLLNLFGITELGSNILEKIRYSLNGILNDGISVTHCEVMNHDFHVLKDVEWKIYEYSLFVRRTKPTIDAAQVYWVADTFDNLNIKNLEKALALFKGEHDVSSFVASDHDAKCTVRKIFWTRLDKYFLDSRIFESSETKNQENFDFSKGVILRLQFCGEGFLKHQVRTMVGTLVQVALNKRDVASVQSLLANPAPRSQSGFCAPSQGLLLKQVSYSKTPEMDLKL